MVSLERALSEHPLAVLRVIGEWWELDLTGQDAPACVKSLAQRLRTLNVPEELLYMSDEEATAFEALVEAGGRLPVGVFSRAHGDVRQMGPARLEREEPWLTPESAAEGLWYRGLLFRAFAETAEGLVEFYFTPDDFVAQFPRTNVVRDSAESLPAPALPPAAPPDRFQPAPDNAVDDLTTILAVAQRYPLNEENIDKLQPYLLDHTPARRSLLIALAWEMGLLRRSEQGVKPTRATIEWLQKSRAQQLQALAEAWSSCAWNELRYTPGLICEEGGWQNDPLLARTALLEHLPPDDAWRTIAALIAHIKEVDPDFQRPNGDYNTWYIRDLLSNAYLQGFEQWDQVEGRLLRFIIEGPLVWLGLADVAGGRYRLTERMRRWLAGQPAPADETPLPLIVQPDATVIAAPQASRHDRFQLSRVAEARPAEPDRPYVYGLTPAALQHALEQGIEGTRVLEFLQRASQRPLPPSVRRAVERWTANGAEGRLQTVVVLRVRDAKILDTLRQNPKTSVYIGETLGELAVAVRAGEWQKLQQATAQLGLLLDVDI